MSNILRNGILVTAVASCGYGNIGCAMDSPGFDRQAPFEEIAVAYKHEWKKGVHPFTGAAVIDVDGDGKMEIFVGGGKDQADALFSYRDGNLKDTIAGTGLSNLSATYGSVSIDMDNNGDVDLVVARNDGVYLYLNENGRFSERKIPLTLPENSVPLAIAVSDIDHDGDGDLYISVFVDFPSFRSATFNDPSHAKKNILLLNNGDLTFTDITEFSGTASKQNTFLSVFVDLNLDGWQDLVVAQNTGEVEIFRNNKDRTFTAVPLHTGFGFWMGLAVGDIDNDGDQDLLFTNVGSSIPAFLTKGDIREDQRHNLEWALLRNDGDFRFTNVTSDYGITGEGFAWGAVFEDLNLDGRLDLLVAQNYIKWPVHKFFKLPGRSYLQARDGGGFKHVKALGLENRFFGQAPLIVDLNDDGKPDVLWVNMDGPVRAFLNRSTQRCLSISVPDRVSMLGTRVRIETSRGESYTREIVAGTGLMTDQTTDLVFGLGEGEEVKRVIITRPDGTRKIIDSPDRGAKITLQ